MDKNFFENLQIYLNGDLEFSILGVNFYEEDIKRSGHLSYGYFKKNNEEKIFNKTLIEVDWIIGCAVIINLSKFKDRSVFDENIFIYFEDFDLCKSLTRKGKKVLSSKILYIKHIGDSSSISIIPELSSDSNKFRNWHWRWSEFYFYKKNYSYFYALKKFISKFLSSLFKMIFYSILFQKINRDKYLYRFLGLLNSMLGKSSNYRG